MSGGDQKSEQPLALLVIDVPPKKRVGRAKSFLIPTFRKPAHEQPVLCRRVPPTSPPRESHEPLGIHGRTREAEREAEIARGGGIERIASQIQS